MLRTMMSTLLSMRSVLGRGYVWCLQLRIAQKNSLSTSMEGDVEVGDEILEEWVGLWK